MAWHRIPLFFNQKCRFWKLMGSGKNGTFDLNPDWQQWALLSTWDTEQDFEHFYQHSSIATWWRICATETFTILNEPLASHGKWSKKEPFEAKNDAKEGPLAVLTRAQIKWTKLNAFWKQVPAAAAEMQQAKGYLFSVGIGEAPLYLQATYSVWDTAESMQNYAYKSEVHAEVIRKTRKEGWYSEELFARFTPIRTLGSLKGINPLASLNITHQP